jgi:pimeloyl-ACP methyl ester carboxylesterase
MTPRRFTTAGGHAIHVEEAGTGPALLALHGLGGGAYFFRSLGALLEPHCRTVAVDLPGTGWSGGDVPRAMDGWIADLGELVRTFVREPVVIVGHSMGTILALKASQAWPDWIRGLVFVGGLPAARQPIRTKLASRAEAITEHGIGGWGVQMAPGVFAPESLRRRAELVGMFERLFEAQDPASYVACINLLITESAVDAVPAVRVPCLAITGANDLYAPPDDVHAFVRQIPGPPRHLVIPDCGHLPFLETPDVFARYVRAFVESLPAGAAEPSTGPTSQSADRDSPVR